MQTWAKRGLRTALVTGGLLMLGTGIAAANENVNPDRSASPIDGGMTIPTHVGDNAVGDVADGTVAGDVPNVPDAGPVQTFGVAAASPGNKEADSLNNTYPTAGGNTVTNGNRGAGEWGALSGDLVNVPAADITHGPAAGNQRAFANSSTRSVSGGTSHTVGDGFLDGTPVVTRSGVNTTVFQVPVDVLGRAVERGHPSTSVTDGDTAPQLNPPIGGNEQFGPSDQVDRLLGANQVPGLHTVPGLLDIQHTQVLPVINDALPATQVFPAVTESMLEQASGSVSMFEPASGSSASTLEPARGSSAGMAPSPARPTPRTQAMPARQAPARYLPMTGELPVGGPLPGAPGGPPPVSANLPTVTNARVPGFSAPTLQSAPALPVLPALPQLPPLPRRPSTQDLPAPTLPHLTAPAVPALPTPHVSGPITTGMPRTQDMPADPAQQLMAQLRAMISELDGHVHPMDGATAVLPGLPIRDEFRPPAS